MRLGKDRLRARARARLTVGCEGGLRESKRSGNKSEEFEVDGKEHKHYQCLSNRRGYYEYTIEHRSQHEETDKLYGRGSGSGSGTISGINNRPRCCVVANFQSPRNYPC